ncbi:MAG: hypothetical protein MJY91_06505 [Bacteroidales bacterium]|nr:hypothetical protein [Bacteroidales bacterium]
MKPLFYSDYLEGAHPEILKALTLTNMEQSPGYGEDTHCKEAASSVIRVCTSWATSDSAVETLLESLESIHTSNQ